MCLGLQRERDANGAGAGADIENRRCQSCATELQCGLDRVLGFRPRDQHGWRDEELASVEFLAAGNVLRRLALHAFMQITAIVNPPNFAQIFIGVRIEP